MNWNKIKWRNVFPFLFSFPRRFGIVWSERMLTSNTILAIFKDSCWKGWRKKKPITFVPNGSKSLILIIEIGSAVRRFNYLSMKQNLLWVSLWMNFDLIIWISVILIKIERIGNLIEEIWRILFEWKVVTVQAHNSNNCDPSR